MLYLAQYPIVVPSYYDGTPIEIPKISLIMPAIEGKNYFSIGLDIDIGDLGYEDFDKIAELIYEQTPPQEVVDFILDFTGIPEEDAVISYAVFYQHHQCHHVMGLVILTLYMTTQQN